MNESCIETWIQLFYSNKDTAQRTTLVASCRVVAVDERNSVHTVALSQLDLLIKASIQQDEAKSDVGR
jgi:hypothetical protein